MSEHLAAHHAPLPWRELIGIQLSRYSKTGPRLAGIVLCLAHADLLDQVRKCLL